MKDRVICAVCKSPAPDEYSIGGVYYCLEHYEKKKEEQHKKDDKRFLGVKLKKFTGD